MIPPGAKNYVTQGLNMPPVPKPKRGDPIRSGDKVVGTVVDVIHDEVIVKLDQGVTLREITDSWNIFATVQKDV